MKVYLYYSGKPRNPHANAMAADYVARAGRYSATEMTEIRFDRFDPWARHPSARKILLDPAGRMIDSTAFAQFFANAEMLGHDLIFVVGGHDGLPEDWRARADALVSLSAMTLPHELARLVVAEQIYRAFAMLRGHPYPR